MSVKKIINLEEIISQYIGENKKIVDTTITNLTAPGENYGSQIYKVDIKLRTQDGENEYLNVVVKQIPDTEFYQKVFNVQVTFNVEKGFYNTVVPTLKDFQRTSGTKVIDIFPKFYGARNNLNGLNGTVDQDALICVENLRVEGYKNWDRYVGFDLPTSKLVLKSLAEFHAVPLALKLRDPQTFDQKIKPYLTSFLPKAPQPNIDDPIEELLKLLGESPESKHLVGKMKKSLGHFGEIPERYPEPFSTLSHRDYWVNNIMLKSEEGVAKYVKIVDFQMITYDTPLSDLFFFLFTSVKTEVLKRSLDELLQYYYQNFIQILTDLKCDTGAFSYDNFLGEIEGCTKIEFGKAFFMTVFIIRGPEGGHMGSGTPVFSTTHLRKEDKDRLFWYVQECERRGWLKF